MTNKNNSKLLKTISMAAIGFLSLGNCSNVWMMEGYESKEITQKQILKNLREQAKNNTNLQNFDLEELANKLFYALIKWGYMGNNCANMAVEVLSNQIKTIKNVNIDIVIRSTVNSLLIKHMNYLINKWDS